jgi:hypothetical protein
MFPWERKVIGAIAFGLLVVCELMIIALCPAVDWIR